MTWTELLPHVMLISGVITLVYNMIILYSTALTVLGRSMNRQDWHVSFKSNTVGISLGILLIIYSQII